MHNYIYICVIFYIYNGNMYNNIKCKNINVIINIYNVIYNNKSNE